MTNAQRILALLDTQLTSRINLTLYGRAALHLGFPDAPQEHALSRDIDAVLWQGQAETLQEQTNFWDAIERVNHELADQELYISHFFTEDQVILLPDWRDNCVPLNGEWLHLELCRLGNLDLLLSKLMRDDPIDRADALFIAQTANLGIPEITTALERARVPDSPEIQEQFALASHKLLDALKS